MSEPLDLAAIRARAEAADVVLANEVAPPPDWPVRLERSAADVPRLLDRLDRAEAALARVRELADEANEWRPYESRDVGEVHPVEAVDDLIDTIRTALTEETK